MMGLTATAGAWPNDLQAFHHIFLLLENNAFILKKDQITF